LGCWRRATSRCSRASRCPWVRYGVSLYHRLHGRVVLFDRYTLDAMVPSGAAIGPLARLSRRVRGHACPRPDVVLVLDASAETMHGRKGEYDEARLEGWRRAYRGLSDVMPAVELIDAERLADEGFRRNPDEVRRDAWARIWRAYARRQRSLHAA
jgi:thymidylate kinase